jgi:hypothetical protein
MTAAAARAEAGRWGPREGGGERPKRKREARAAGGDRTREPGEGDIIADIRAKTGLEGTERSAQIRLLFTDREAKRRSPLGFFLGFGLLFLLFMQK